jgi:MFS family permease
MPRIDNRSLALAACAICPAVVLGVFLVFPLWAPAWMGDFGKNRGEVMLVYSASGLLMTLTMPIVGRLLTRVAAWRLIVVGAVLLGGGLIVASMLTNYLAFAVVYVLAIGLGVSLAGIIPGQTVAVRLFPRHVGAIGGLIMISLAVAGMIFPLVLAPLEAAIGWRGALAATGGAVLILLPLVAFGMLRGKEGAADAAPAPDAAPAEASTAQILKARGFWIIIAGLFPLMAASTAVQANLLPILADHGVGQGQASVALAAMAIGSAAGAAAFGWLADRFDPRMVIAGSATLMAAAAVALAGGGGVVAALVATIALGLASGGTLPLQSIFAFRQFGAAYAPAVGLLNLFMLPYMLAPPLIGFVRDQTGSYSLCLLVAAPVLLVGAAATWRLKSAQARGGVAPPHHVPAE